MQEVIVSGRRRSTVGGTGWGQTIINSTVPGAYYAGQAELAFRGGRYLLGVGHSIASLAEAGLGVFTLGESTAALSTMRAATFGVRSAVRGSDEAFHYTFSRVVEAIEKQGLRAGSYATPNGALSPLQAQIDLALSPNGLRDAVLRIDLAGLRRAGYEIPEVTQVGRSFGMPGGGYEMRFPYSIPSEFITVIRP